MYALYGIVFLAIGVVIALVFNPVLALGLIVLGVLVFALTGFGKGLRNAKVGAGSGPSGVPTTRDASYDPGGGPTGTTGT